MFRRVRIVFVVCVILFPYPAMAMNTPLFEPSAHTEGDRPASRSLSRKADVVDTPGPFALAVIAGGALVVGGVVYRLRSRCRT